MTPREAALQYAETVPVFPCFELPGALQKTPRTPRGFHDATRDPDIIRRWWKAWQNAWIGMPTGQVSGRWVLDIDVKRPAENGFDSLEDLGHLPLPETPMAHTATAGVHVYVETRGRELRNSAGLIGAGLDVRGDGGYVILPTPGSGYYWDPIWNFETVQMAAAADWLWPPKPSRPPLPNGLITPVEGLGPYGTAAIESACNAIVGASPGQQERTLNAECFSIGTAAGAGLILFRQILPCARSYAQATRCRITMPDGHGGLRRST
jgi:hypothetical protein